MGSPFKHKDIGGTQYESPIRKLESRFDDLYNHITLELPACAERTLAVRELQRAFYFATDAIINGVPGVFQVSFPADAQYSIEKAEEGSITEVNELGEPAPTEVTETGEDAAASDAEKTSPTETGNAETASN